MIKGKLGKENLKRKCPNCGKKRLPRLFPEGEKKCLICQVPGAKKATVVVSLPSLKKSVQLVFNKYIRLRDKNLPCISCGATTARAWHAGHYWAQGMNGALRYDENNVHKQCDSCNVWKHGNLLNYRINLLKKIGEDMVVFLDNYHGDIFKWTREDLELILKNYKQKIKDLS